MRLSILQFSYRFFFGGGAKHYITQVCQPPPPTHTQPRIGSLRLLAFPRAKIAVESEVICEFDGHTVHKVNQRRLTADGLAPQGSDCSRMRSKVSSDRLPSYIKSTRPVLEIFKNGSLLSGQPSYVRCILLLEARVYCLGRRSRRLE
jgi:hypothetical protein